MNLYFANYNNIEEEKTNENFRTLSRNKNGGNDAMCKKKPSWAHRKWAQKLSLSVCLTWTSSTVPDVLPVLKALMSGRGNICAIKDDFQWLLDKMLDADGIVVADPIFEKGAQEFSVQLPTALAQEWTAAIISLPEKSQKQPAARLRTQNFKG